MTDLIASFANMVFFYGLSGDLSHLGDKNRIRLKFKDFFIKEQETDGVIVENMILSVDNFDLKKENIFSTIGEASFIVEKFNLLVSKSWLNKVIKSDQSLNKFGIFNLRIDFSKNKLIVYGNLKKGITVSFSAEIKFTIDNGMIKVDFDRFWAGDMIPLPQMFQNFLLSQVESIIKSKLKIPNCVYITKHFVKVNHKALAPLDIYLDFTNVLVDDHFLVIQGGFDVEKAREKIAEKQPKE